jgi:hypothetical protein
MPFAPVRHWLLQQSDGCAQYAPLWPHPVPPVPDGVPTHTFAWQLGKQQSVAVVHDAPGPPHEAPPSPPDAARHALWKQIPLQHDALPVHGPPTAWQARTPPPTHLPFVHGPPLQHCVSSVQSWLSSMQTPALFWQ